MTVTAPGTGTVFAADLVASANYPKSKLAYGVDGTATDVSSSNPLPTAIIGPVAAPADTGATGTIAMAATTNAVQFTLAGQAGLGVEVFGTWTGTLVFEAQVGASGTWTTINGIPLGGGPRVSIITANAVMELIGAGITTVRVRCSIIGTGTASVVIVATAAQRLMRVFSTDSANLVTLNYAFATTAAPAYTTGVNSLLSVNLAGGLRVDGSGAAIPTDARVGDGAGNLLTPLFAVISATTLGASNVIVAATATKRIRVLGYTLVCTVANTITWFDATTAISGAMAFAANGGASETTTPLGLFQTTAGNGLNMTLSAATQVSGHIVYVLV